MTVHQSTIILSTLLAAQLLGLASAALARLSEGSRYQASGQRLFFASLGLVGLTIVAALLLGPGYWLTSGATFSLMVLTATCDFSHTGRSSLDRPIAPPIPDR